MLRIGWETARTLRPRMARVSPTGPGPTPSPYAPALARGMGSRHDIRRGACAGFVEYGGLNVKGFR